MIETSFFDTKTYSLFRFHWDGLGINDVQGRLLEILQSSGDHSLKTTTWHLGNIRQIELGRVSLIVAALGAERSRSEYDFDPEAKTFIPIIEEPRAENLLEVVFFENLHCFLVETRSQPSANAQATYVKKMIESSPITETVGFYYDAVLHKSEFLDRVFGLDALLKYHVTLRPSNPNYGDAWKEADEELRGARIKTMKKTAAAKDGNGMVTDSKIVQSDMSQVADGYGSATVFGIENGEKVKIQSSTNQASVVSEGVENEGERYARLYADVSALANLSKESVE